MEPNDNPPSDREWTLEEMEEFFKSQDAVTGLFNGGMASNATWFNTSKPIGIHITSITPPPQGWPIAFYCPLCKETWFKLSPWAIKPEKGDYWRMEMCGSDIYRFKHNMELGMKGFRDKSIDLEPSLTPWWMIQRPIAYQLLDPLPHPSISNIPMEMEFTQELSIEEVKRRYPDTPIGEDK